MVDVVLQLALPSACSTLDLKYPTEGSTALLLHLSLQCLAVGILSISEGFGNLLDDVQL